jgi:two-component system, LytTR family, response regulator
MKKVAVIDDEAAGRTLIKQYLTEYPNLIVVGEANNGVDAIKIINEFKPDLIFLDIQMPGLTGFEILEHLEEIPQIIFSTAYDKYALQAFEVHAVDYLLKPYTRERFKHAVQRIRNEEQPNPVQPLAESLLINSTHYPESILVQIGQKLINIAVTDIIWIEADGDYARLITLNGKYLSNYGISILEAKLNPNSFIRVHRSSLINLKYIKEVQKYPSNYDVIMQNNDVVRVSRGYMDNLKKLMY